MKELREDVGVFSSREIQQAAGISETVVSNRTMRHCLNAQKIFYLQCRKKGLKIYKPKLESIFVEILNPNNKNIVVGCIYKHPTMVALEFMEDYLSKTLETLPFENKHLILLGDFNINLLNYDTDHNTNDFLDLLTSNSLLPTNFKAHPDNHTF